MGRKPIAADQQPTIVQVRLPRRLIEIVDSRLAVLQERDPMASRSDVLREAIALAHESWGVEDRKKTAK